MTKTSLIAVLLLGAAIFISSGQKLAAQPTVDNNSEVNNSMDLKNSKVLIAYFSHSGNTRAVAREIQGLVGGEMFELATVDPYPEEYRPTTEQARRELDQNYRPPLQNMVQDLAGYEVIFLGYPNWWGTMPMALFTFLEAGDFSGKTIIPFCTHEGSRLGRSVDDLTRLAPKSTILNGFEIRGSRAADSRESLSAWLRGLGLI